MLCIDLLHAEYTLVCPRSKSIDQIIFNDNTKSSEVLRGARNIVDDAIEKEYCSPILHIVSVL